MDILKQLLKLPLPTVAGVVLGMIWFSGQPAITPPNASYVLYAVAVVLLGAAGYHVLPPNPPATGGGEVRV